MDKLLSVWKSIPEYKLLLEAAEKGRSAAVTGRLCVIGSALKEQALKELFELD